MKRYALILALIGSAALAQYPARGRISQGASSSSGSATGGTADGGVALNAADYRTSADMALFVDPTGSDSNACTSSGASACLTLQGCLNKFPKLLRHKVSCAVAAGSYAGVTISGFTVDPSVQKTTAGILIDGTLANVTPATGSATQVGTVGGTAGATTTYGTLTDTGQAWTVNDPAIVGKLLIKTGGTGSGEVRIIVSNTATALTIAGTHTAPTGTTTYAIQAPSSIITTAAAAIPTPLGAVAVATGGVQITNNNAPSTTLFIAVRNMGIATGGSAPIQVNGLQGVQFLQNVITSTTGITISNHANCLFTTSSLIGTGILISAINYSFASLVTSYVQSTSAGGLSGLFRSRLIATSSQLSVTSGAPLTVAQDSIATATSVRCDCNSGASTACLAVDNGNSPTLPGFPSSANVATALSVTNCSYGVAAQTGVISFSSVATFSGNSLIYSAASVNGGRIILPSAITITSGTADLSVDDGATTATYASLAALYSCLTSLATGSKVCRL